jgi:hypothetical protein
LNLKPNINQVKGMDVLKEINVPPSRILIDGSGVMALYGIRENADLDIAIPFLDFIRIQKEQPMDYEFKYGGFAKIVMLLYKNVEIHHTDWDGTETETSLANTPVIGGYHWHTLETIYHWKKLAKRDKDITDCKLIEEFWRFKKEKEKEGLTENNVNGLIEIYLKRL